MDWRELYLKRTEEEREALKKVPRYKGSIKWITKVECMTPKQVNAVFMDFTKRKMWSEKPKIIFNPEKKDTYIEEQIEMDLSSFLMKGDENIGQKQNDHSSYFGRDNS